MASLSLSLSPSVCARARVRVCDAASRMSNTVARALSVCLNHLHARVCVFSPLNQRTDGGLVVRLASSWVVARDTYLSRPFLHVCICVCVCVCVCVCAWTYAPRVHSCTRMFVCVYFFLLFVCVCVCIDMCTSECTFFVMERVSINNTHSPVAYVPACLCVCIDTYIQTCTFVRTRKDIGRASDWLY